MNALLRSMICVAGWLVVSGIDSIAEETPLWDSSITVPSAEQLNDIEGVEFHVIKNHEPQADKFDWLHGIALAWHGSQLFASYGHNHGKENTASEIANYSISTDSGVTWSVPKLIDDGQEDNLAVSHGVFLSDRRKLWAFQGAFYGRMKNIHTRAYELDEATSQWTQHGTVIQEGFWPMQEPQRLADGNWMMAGLQVVDGIGKPNNPAAVAISHGDDLLKWDLVSIPKPPEVNMWGESTVLIDGSNVVNISRYQSPMALTANSDDFGRTWTTTKVSNLPMAASKPYAGVLSTGQRYLIGNTTADNRNRRWPLTIAVTDTQGKQFRRTYRIRHAIHNGPGESHASAALSYPYAVEHNGKLYVAYSNNGGRGANRNSAELAIIPIESLASQPLVHSGNLPSSSSSESIASATLSTEEHINGLWDITWRRFYLPRTHLFYDYLTSYEPGHELAHLPTAEEIQRQYPNECGYDTGMEDGMISAGVMLSLIVDRYAVTKDEELRQQALDVFKGIRLCATAHGVPGFLARAVCKEDLTSIYPNSSRDQYTHAVHGLWLFAGSPLCSPETRQEIASILSDIANRMTRNVIPENNYDSLRADGTRDTRGISRMWNVQGHEAARLPMIYAAAWDVTGKQEFYDLYRKYLEVAVEQSLAVKNGQPTYALLQMQASLELLLALERDERSKEKMQRIMVMVASQCAERARSSAQRAENLDLTILCTDWRTDEGLSSEGRYRTVWYCIRESGEAALAQLMVNGAPLPETQRQRLHQIIGRLDHNRVSSCGIYYLQAAYWKDRRRSESQTKTPSQ